jgi:hypothetical protein
VNVNLFVEIRYYYSLCKENKNLKSHSKLRPINITLEAGDGSEKGNLKSEYAKKKKSETVSSGIM